MIELKEILKETEYEYSLKKQQLDFLITDIQKMKINIFDEVNILIAQKILNSQLYETANSLAYNALSIGYLK